MHLVNHVPSIKKLVSDIGMAQEPSAPSSGTSGPDSQVVDPVGRKLMVKAFSVESSSPTLKVPTGRKTTEDIMRVVWKVEWGTQDPFMTSSAMQDRSGLFGSESPPQVSTTQSEVMVVT